jgi:translation elongation factor P
MIMFRSALLAVLLSSVTAFSPSLHTSSAILARRNVALNVAIDTSDIKNGLTVEIDGEPHKVLSFSIMKQARGAAKTTIKFKNLMRGNTIENTYRSGEKFETAMIEKKAAQYTYSDEAGNFYFMDSDSFEEVMVESKLMEDVAKWIAEGMECSLVFFKGNVIEVQVPGTYVYEIVETEPSVKGNTANAHTKPATLNSGAVVTIPGFIEQGTKIKVDTAKGEYLERA